MNCLIGKKLQRDEPPIFEDDNWTFRTDPVLGAGLQEVDKVIRKMGLVEFDSAPPGDFDWPRFFKLEMAYLLLWSAIERFLSLLAGPALEPGEKLRCLAADPDFAKCLSAVVTETRRIHDARDPGEGCTLNSERPLGAARYYYQVRNNLSHRGKGAWSDAEIVRKSLCELSDIFKRTLELKGCQRA